jgi:hypothetical protein
MIADALFSAGKVATFTMHVSRTTRKVRSGSSQRPYASLAFDERNRLGFGHDSLNRTTLPRTTAVAFRASLVASRLHEERDRRRRQTRRQRAGDD